MSVRNELFKQWGRSGMARTRLEPIKPGKGFPTIETTYFMPVYGHPHKWMQYCLERYDWLLWSLIRRGVSLEHFQPGSKEIPKRKCWEIAKALRKIKAEGDFDDFAGEKLLKTDIAFWAHCGGVRIHEWKTLYE